MKDKDCFFFIDLSVPEEERCISILCVKCHDEKMPDTGWFYPGSKEGYGPYEFKCCLCGDLLHKTEDDEQITERDDENS